MNPGTEAPRRFGSAPIAGRMARAAPCGTIGMMATHAANEVGVAPARGRRQVPHHEAEETLSDRAGKEILLGEGVRATSGPTTCPACGAADVMWGCNPKQTRTKEEIHPLVWDETAWMADSFVCSKCDAGWIEPDDPKPITWVRPYWVLK